MWKWKYIRLLVHQHFKSNLFIREQSDLHKASYLTVKWLFDTKLLEVSTGQAFWEKKEEYQQFVLDYNKISISTTI